MNHDQSFKNLILDYPQAALEFFAKVRDLAGAVITPLREEQLQEILGSRYRRLDVPLLAEWPDGRRAGIAFIIEEETEPANFSIHRLVHYCVDLAELLKTERVVPVVVFLRPGRFPRALHLGDGGRTYLSFEFIHCQLSQLPAVEYLDSGNIVARLNLPNMRHPPGKRLEVYHSALSGLCELEPSPRKQLKYADFIDNYAALTDEELALYRATFINQTGEDTMGLAAILREEGRQEGRREGRQEGRREGRQEGESALLLRQMALRFGPLDEALRERIRTADADTLLAWGERLLAAATPEDVVK